MKTSLLLCLLSVALLGGCVSQPANYTVVSTYLKPHADSVADYRKVYHLSSDLHGNGWVMRKGTRITFNADGSGELSTVVFAMEGLPLPNAIQLESIQYGSDGNIEFAFPGNDVGQPLHMRHARRNYPYRIPFGYKKAYFSRIHSVKFVARLLCEPGLPGVTGGSSYK